MDGSVTAAVLTMLLLLLPASEAAHVSGPEPEIFVFVNPPHPRADDVLDIDLHTFLNGAPADTDGFPTATLTHLGYESPVLPFAKEGPGHYRTSIGLTGYASPAEPGARTDQGLVTVQGMLQTRAFVRHALVKWFVPGLYLRLSLSETAPLVGEQVEIEIKTYDGTALRNPDMLEVVATLPTEPETSLNLMPTRTDVGVSNATLIIPPHTVDPTLTSSLRSVRIEARARVDGVEVATQTATQPTRYQVWCRLIPRESGAVVGNLYVADPLGGPAGGVPATVILGSPQEFVTDESGKLPVFTVSFGGGCADGQVAPGTAWETSFRAPEKEPAYTGGVRPLDAPFLPDGTLREFLRPHREVTRVLQILDSPLGRGGSAADLSSVVPREPLANASLNYYIWTVDGLIAAGSERTDALGRLSMTFKTTSRDATIAFHEGPSLVGTATYKVASPHLGLRVSPIELGGRSAVRAIPGADLADVVDTRARFFHRSSITMFPLVSGETWVPWASSPDELHPTTKGHGHSYHLPSFLPRHARFLVTASLETSSQPITQWTVLGVGEEADIPVLADVLPEEADERAGFATLLQQLGPPIALVSVGVLVFLLIRRRRRRPPGGTPRGRMPTS